MLNAAALHRRAGALPYGSGCLAGHLRLPRPTPSWAINFVGDGLSAALNPRSELG